MKFKSRSKLDKVSINASIVYWLRVLVPSYLLGRQYVRSTSASMTEGLFGLDIVS